ncbi:MAG: glycosyltransferase family 4 protein [Spiribacter salinus]|uniref:Glycosyltransferase family 4 protein n=1 Tax=Spiribacter salinus TaxID=1335746 RepID=A0A540VTP3_9GAMM|nr:MAG: glycosyltransferase family 4 protein [Spiribacter salinus]
MPSSDQILEDRKVRPGTGSAARVLRVLHVGPLPPPVGGMATVIRGLQEHQPHQMRVLDTRKTTPEGRRLWRGIVAQLRLLLQLVSACCGWRPHIVHVHTCSAPTFWRSAVDVMVARLLGRRVVLHVHGARFHRFLAGLGRGAAFWARRTFAMAHATIVLGSDWREIIAPWCPPGRVHVVPNGVEVPEVPADRSAGKPLHLVCLANYEMRKGQGDLIRALAELGPETEVTLALAGAETEKGTKAQLARLAESLGVAERVTLADPVSGKDKDELLVAAHVFALASYDEGLPMAMLEAMANAMPVIVTRVGAIPEVITDREDGYLVECGDVKAIAAVIRELAASPSAVRRVGQAGHALAAREYSLARVVGDVESVYTSLWPPAAREVST